MHENHHYDRPRNFVQEAQQDDLQHNSFTHSEVYDTCYCCSATKFHSSTQQHEISCTTDMNEIAFTHLEKAI